MSLLLGAALGSTALGGLYSANQASGINKRNINFQKYMAQNAHQMEVKDLKAAGLNPILSAGAGKGAQASGGSSVPIPNPMANMPQAVQAAAQSRLSEAQASKAESEKDFVDLSMGKVTPEILKIKEETRKIGQEIKSMRANVMQQLSQTKNVNADTRLKTLASALAEVDNAIYQGDYGTAIRLLEKPGLAGTAAALGFSIKGYSMILNKANRVTKAAKVTKSNHINRGFGRTNKLAPRMRKRK